VKYTPLKTLCFIVAIIVCVIFLFWVTKAPDNRVDWLARSDWAHFTGAEKKEGYVKFFPTSKVINHRDTSTAQPNPPVNLYSSHLKVSGDFSINMELSEVQNEAIVQFYGQAPIVYDEWRQERPSVRVTVKSDGVKIQIWDGTGANSIDERELKLNLKSKINLGLIHKNDELTIIVDGKVLGSIPDHSIFDSGTVWFGADAKLNTNGWSLHSLSVHGSKKGNVEIVDLYDTTANKDDPNTLRNLSQNNERKIPIGVAVSINPLLTDEKYKDTALSQFNMMTPENSLKPQSIHPLKDLYTFNDADILVKIAENNQMLVHGHALVMGKANPEWMQKTPVNERQQIMVDHIKTVIGHYKGKIAQWDVVNEPLSEDIIDYSSEQKGLRKHMWSDALGEQYIDIAFKTAREADPSAKLYLNDFGLEKDGHRWDAFLELVKRLQARGVPIDGVGFESHVYHSPADDIDPIVLKKHIQQLATLGLVSRISEIDVLGDKPDFQAEQYANVLKVCLDEPSCTSFGAWGITDLYGSTALSDRYPVMFGDSLLWDSNYVPKLAYSRLQEILNDPAY
jgi:endo-1,4-beta-xylanase